MNNSRIKKIALTGILSAIAVVGSLFSFPIFGSRASPIQHMVNIICAVLLGPYYGLAAAFIASVLRNMLGLGTILAFPGSMIGAFLAGLAYRKTKSMFWAGAGEVIGTGIIGGLTAWPLAILFLGESVGNIAFYVYIIPFLLSTVAGTLIAVPSLSILKRNGFLTIFEENE